jgi:hypothetical protein
MTGVERPGIERLNAIPGIDQQPSADGSVAQIRYLRVLPGNSIFSEPRAL